MSETPKHVVTVTDSGSGRYSQRVTVGRHVLAADEPVSNGGQDSGPSPHEYVLAGLGACTAVTLRMYVERHNWMLRRTTVELQHKKIPATDGASKIDHFHRTIHLEGDLTEERRLSLFQVAEKCPVSETLRHAAIVDSILAGAPSPIPEQSPSWPNSFSIRLNSSSRTKTISRRSSVANSRNSTLDIR